MCYENYEVNGFWHNFICTNFVVGAERKVSE